MKVGSLVYATTQGLGILAKAFYDHGVVTHPLVIRHGSRETHEWWFPGAPIVSDLRRDYEVLKEHCAKVDVMLFFETPFNWNLLPWCRQIGVPTVLMPMHECMPDPLPEWPDLLLCPSRLDFECYSAWKRGDPQEQYQFLHPNGITKSVYLPIPVEVPWRQRTKAEVFVHNAGNGGLRGRNGTKQLIEALWHVRSMAKFIIRSQEPLNKYDMPYEGQRVDLRTGTFPAETLWDEGDVFVFPEKFNGLSLPLQEARAAGMLVMGSDRFPMNEWLPTVVETTTPDNKEFRTHASPLIPVKEYRTTSVGGPCRKFEEAVIDPKVIAEKIDEWYGRDISAYSQGGKEWAQEMSWERLGPKYKALLEGLR